MKRINPLYLILLFLTLVFISFYVLQDKHKQLNTTFKEYQNIQQKAQTYKSLKSKWTNKNFVNKEIQKISKNSMFKNISINNGKNKIELSLQSDNPKTLEAFINKILNKPFIIKKMNIQQKNISLQLGVK